MLLLSILVCFSALLQASLSTPVWVAKAKPVELKYSCLTIIPAEEQNFKPDNVPIILLHGITKNKKDWDGISQLLALETKKKVCVADLRNHGESPWNDEEYSTEVMAEDINHLIDKLQAPKAIVLGHSLGGKTAVHLALNYPEKVEKIIVEDMRPNGITPEGHKAVRSSAKIFIELEKYIPQGVTEIEAKNAFFKILQEQFQKLNLPFKLKNPSLLPIKCSDGKCQWTTNPVLFHSLLEKEIEDLLTKSSGRFDGPVLFIYGGKSIFKVGDDKDSIKELFPNAKLVEVEEAGHMVHKSKQFLTEVIKFINDK